MHKRLYHLAIYNKNLTNTNTLSTTDSLSALILSIQRTKKRRAQTEKNTSEASGKKKQKKKKEDNLFIYFI